MPNILLLHRTFCWTVDLRELSSIRVLFELALLMEVLEMLLYLLAASVQLLKLQRALVGALHTLQCAVSCRKLTSISLWAFDCAWLGRSLRHSAHSGSMACPTNRLRITESLCTTKSRSIHHDAKIPNRRLVCGQHHASKVLIMQAALACSTVC